MTESTRLGLNTLAAALMLGLLGDALLRGTPWGINLTLWVFALTAAFLLVQYRQTGQPPTSVRQRLGGLLVFAAAFAWRDSVTLKVLDVLSCLMLLALLVSRTRILSLHFASVWDILRGLFLIPVQALSGAFILLLGDVAWNTIPRGGGSRQALAVTRGFLLALPLLVLFGALLASADAVFSHFLGLAFQWDPSLLASHIALIGICGWLAAGLLRALLFVPAHFPQDGNAVSASRPVLGTIETGTVLGLLNLLFLSFVLVQFRYFFGGAALVQATIGLTYAQYARQGFFELVAVAVLVLPLLLSFHSLQRSDDARGQRLFQWLAGVLVGLLFVIMASAIVRMRLYQNEYGLTELRLYTSTFIGWLAIVFVWFAATVLRGQRPRFAGGALLSAFAVVLALHAVNPDAVIVRANLAHAAAGHPFDADYAVGLSADASPTLAAALSQLSPPDQAHILRALHREQRDLGQQDWRTEDLSLLEARIALRHLH